MTVLMTGASGYIGRHLNKKIDCIPVTRQTCDLADSNCIRALPKGVDTVVHLAGYVNIAFDCSGIEPVPSKEEDIYKLYRDNVLSTANVVTYCLENNVNHLVYASTLAVYGFGHSSYPAPLEYYAASKLAAEQLLSIATKQGIRVCVLRLPGVYGGDRKSGIVYNMAQEAITKHEINVSIPYRLPMDIMHIEDVTQAIKSAVTKRPMGTIKVTTGEPCSPRIIAEKIAHIVGDCKVHVAVQHPIMQFDPVLMQVQLGLRPLSHERRLTEMVQGLRLRSTK